MPRRTALLAGAVALAVASCGGEATSTTEEDAASTEDAAATDTSDAEASGEDGGWPVTVQHAHGETTIEAAPERVAAVAWANHEVPLALGVVPVGMAEVTWGDDDADGVLPWVEDELSALEADTPVLFDETDGFDVEAVAATEPDLILASYSGITEDEYASLSRIAPVIAYPDVAWGTSWEDMVLANSTAMGMAAEGEELVADLRDTVQQEFDAHPELADATVMFAFFDPADTSQIGFYTTHDTRPGFLHDLGMGVPQVVADQSSGTEAFSTSISAEQADLLDDVDLLVTYGEDLASTLVLLRGDERLATIPAVDRGSVVVLENSTPLAASANPSPLSIGWGVDDYFELLASGLDAS